PSGPGQVSVLYRRAWGFGQIGVPRVGIDSAAEVQRALRDLCDTAGAEVVYLELSLADPGTPTLCTAAEAAGFLVSGVGVNFVADGDVLRLQYLNTPLDTSLLQVYSPF